MFSKYHLFNYRIVYSSTNELAVTILPVAPQISRDEYIRLWVYYNTKIIHDIFRAHRKVVAGNIELLNQVIAEPFNPETDCLQRAGLENRFTFTADEIVPITAITGSFYVKETSHRMLSAKIHENITQEQLIVSSLGLLQKVIDYYASDPYYLETAYWTVVFFTELFTSKSLKDLTAMIDIPEIAYNAAMNRMAKGDHLKYMSF